MTTPQTPSHHAPETPQGVKPDTQTWPPSPDVLIQGFVFRLAELSHGDMTPTDNPGFVMVAAADGCRSIERILGEAQDYVKQGAVGARDVALSYRAAYTVLHAIEESAKKRDYGTMSKLLKLGYFAGMDDEALRQQCLQNAGQDTEKVKAVEHIDMAEMKDYLLHQQITAQKEVSSALRGSALAFDRMMFSKGLYTFASGVKRSPGYSAQSVINHAQKAGLGFLGGSTALAYLGWISPEFALVSAITGTALSSGYALVDQRPHFSSEQLAQLSSGLATLTHTVDRLEKAAAAREAEEKAAQDAQRKGR